MGDHGEPLIEAHIDWLVMTDVGVGDIRIIHDLSSIVCHHAILVILLY